MTTKMPTSSLLQSALSLIGQTVEKIEELLGATGANLMYAGYPYDPFAPGAPRS
jgi:hypothetical protein